MKIAEIMSNITIDNNEISTSSNKLDRTLRFDDIDNLTNEKCAQHQFVPVVDCTEELEIDKYIYGPAEIIEVANRSYIIQENEGTQVVYTVCSPNSSEDIADHYQNNDENLSYYITDVDNNDTVNEVGTVDAVLQQNNIKLHDSNENGALNLTKVSQAKNAIEVDDEDHITSSNNGANNCDYQLLSINDKEMQQINHLGFIDIPFVNTPTVEIQTLNKGLMFMQLMYLNFDITDDMDAPEYIDVNDLRAPIEYQESNPELGRKNAQLPLFVKCNKADKTKSENAIADKVGLNSSDDDVIFVKEYSAYPTAITSKTLNDNYKSPSSEDTIDLGEIRIYSDAKSKSSAPRRNPKRKVQIEKASVDLARQLSMPQGTFSTKLKKTCPKISKEQPSVRSCRRSSRTTGAVLSPPSPFRAEDYKEWPTEGMHERPEYNPNTKQIEKFDFTTRKITKVPKTKTCASSTPFNKVECKVLRDGKRFYRSPKNILKRCTGTPKVKKCQKMGKHDFAYLTHERLQMTLSYINQVKEYNNIVQGSNLSEKSDKGVNSSLETKFKKIWKVDEAVHCNINNMSKDCIQEENVRVASSLLADSCILYSFVNNVNPKQLISCLSNLNPEEVSDWLDNEHNNI